MIQNHQADNLAELTNDINGKFGAHMPAAVAARSSVCEMTEVV